MADAEAQISFQAVLVNPADIIPASRAAGREAVTLALTPAAILESLTPPSVSRFESFKAPAPISRPLVVDIETTGLEPWNSRIIAIGYARPERPDEAPGVIVDEDERALIQRFLEVFKGGGFTELIGYNVAFDYRFLYARAMIYRLPLAELFNASLTDVAQRMKQVKEAFVFGNIKPGKLDDWGKLLFNLGKLGTIQDLWIAWKEKDFDYISEYNARDVLLTAGLYNLTEFSNRTPILFTTNPTTLPEGDFWTAKCPVDLSEHQVPITQREFKCPIDGSVILRP